MKVNFLLSTSALQPWEQFLGGGKTQKDDNFREGNTCEVEKGSRLLLQHRSAPFTQWVGYFNFYFEF